MQGVSNIVQGPIVAHTLNYTSLKFPAWPTHGLKGMD